MAGVINKIIVEPFPVEDREIPGEESENSSSEVKKSSYYVLFLGAKESRGLRGSHFIEPVLEYFIEQEPRLQSLRATLQVGNRGLKILPVNNNVTQNTEKDQSDSHFIPHHAITCVFQPPHPNNDIVCITLLIYNPDTRCPVHVHCYRCDNSRTATHLKDQLETLVNREDNQKKFRDIETRLNSKGGHRGQTPEEFDSRTTSSSSENSSDRGFVGSGITGVSQTSGMAFENLTQELKERLNARSGNAPLLFPPRDYDTVHRQRGNLIGIESRRCSNPAVVGKNAVRRSYPSRDKDSCGRSSGIGSAEDNPSPIHDNLGSLPPVPSSSDDEEWMNPNLVVTESSQFLVRPMWAVLPSSSPTKSPLPPPLPKRPEMRQRSPDHLLPSIPPPPAPPNISKERFEGVRQKWEKLDSQYVTRPQPMRSHDSLDEGYRSREAAEADYRRQLSRESLLRSLSRSKNGSGNSLDLWVAEGIRSRGMWRKLGEQEDTDSPHPSTNPNGTGMGGHYSTPLSPKRMIPPFRKLHTPQTAIIPESKCQLPRSPVKGPTFYSPNMRAGSTKLNEISRKGYRELEDQDRYPGLDKDTARLVLSTSNLNLSQHIYSEPFEQNRHQKSKKFSFAFWKSN